MLMSCVRPHFILQLCDKTCKRNKVGESPRVKAESSFNSSTTDTRDMFILLRADVSCERKTLLSPLFPTSLSFPGCSQGRTPQSLLLSGRPPLVPRLHGWTQLKAQVLRTFYSFVNGVSNFKVRPGLTIMYLSTQSLTVIMWWEQEGALHTPLCIWLVHKCKGGRIWYKGSTAS